jgi:hypothetical protein
MKKPDIFQYILGIAVIVMLAVLIILLFTQEISEANKTLLIIIATTFINKLNTIYDYYFGSSKGSADKDIILQKNKDDGTDKV